MRMEGYKTGDVARRVGIHPNTARTWADTFSTHFSDSARGSRRKFTEKDVRVLATIAHLRDRGFELDDIQDLLKNPENFVDLPPEPDEAEAARRAVALVPQAQVERALDRIVQLENERDKLLAERDSALNNNVELNTRINTLEREIGVLEGQLQVLKVERRPASYWLTVIAAVAIAVVIVAALVILLLMGQSAT